jgi:predicted nucleotide-binding protein
MISPMFRVLDITASGKLPRYPGLKIRILWRKLFREFTLQKTKKYVNTRFNSAAIEEARQALTLLNPDTESSESFSGSSGNVSWGYDNIEEFFAALPENDYAYYQLHRFSQPIRATSVYLTIQIFSRSSEVRVQLPKRSEIEKIFNIFERYAPECAIPEETDKGREDAIRVFIGHGRSSEWRDLKDHLHDKHGYEIVAYEVGSRAGHTVRDILDEMLDRASSAFLVLSGEDEMPDGTFHARQNVIHETGLFQGRLGFSKAIVLLEEGTEEFSNIAGIEQIRYAKGRIKETFGDVLAVLRREFGPNV